MRVFVAGGTGLVGSRLIHRLQKRNDKVILLTRRPESARERFGPTVTVVEGDPTASTGEASDEPVWTMKSTFGPGGTTTTTTAPDGSSTTRTTLPDTVITSGPTEIHHP